MKQLKALNKYFWKYRLRLGVGFIFIVISNYFGVLSPQITGFIIEFVQKSTQNNTTQLRGRNYDILVQKFIQWVNTNFSGHNNVLTVIIFCGVIILIVALLRGFFMFLMRQTIIVMSRLIEYDQKNDVYKQYQKLDTAFYKKNSTGDMMSRMAEDVSRVRMFTGPAIMYFINLTALISLSVFYMIKREPELTLYVLAPLPLLAFTIFKVNTIINRRSEKVQASLAAITTNAQESYSGIRVIKSFVQEKAMFGFFKNNSEAYRQNAIGLAKVEAMYFPFITLLIGLSTLLTIMIGGLYYLNNNGKMNTAIIVEFVMYVNMLTFPVSAIGWTASITQRAAASQKRLNEFLDIKSDLINAVNAIKPALKGGIEFKDVDFVYPDTGIHALKKINFHINPGEKIAIVGKTGSGKSTIAQLLLRMYDPASGDIMLDGNNIKEIDMQYLRNEISYVPQDVFLFSDSVKGNILFGREKGDDIIVEKASKQAYVHNEIEVFSDKYETLVGERGVTLSGGQKQRISIARALAKDPCLVIFDDCLSAVDAKTEKEIISGLYEFLEDKTAIIITHRIFSHFDFDRILVLEDGNITEQGNHKTLIAAGGYYAAMFSRQQDNEEKYEA